MTYNRYANTLFLNRQDLVTGIDGTLRNIAQAYHDCAIDYTQAVRTMRDAGACEPEIRELLDENYDNN